jgi:protein-disulfide isomerase
MVVLVGAAAGSAVWFTILQKWVVGAFCPYCMAAHIIGVLLAAFVIWRAPRDLFRIWIWILVGLALAGILAACQIGFPPPTVSRGGESQNNLTAIDPHAAPLVGSPDAPYVVTLLFDYKCSHCQQMHFMLDEAIRRHGGKLAFALCPTPLNTKCNPYVPRDVEEFKDSCELARVALAVWLARREAFPAFDRWMFSLESGDRWHPRSLDAARTKAVELVGQANFDAAWADPWIDRYLQASIRIYGDTGGNAIPKLVFGSRWVAPELHDADDLISILHDSLAVPGP